MLWIYPASSLAEALAKESSGDLAFPLMDASTRLVRYKEQHPDASCYFYHRNGFSIWGKPSKRGKIISIRR